MKNTKNPRRCGRTRLWADQDYVDKLSPAEAEFLKQFNAEYYEDSYSSDKSVTIHTSPEHLKANRDSKNASRRDILSHSQEVVIANNMEARQKAKSQPRRYYTLEDVLIPWPPENENDDEGRYDD